MLMLIYVEIRSNARFFYYLVNMGGSQEAPHASTRIKL